MSDTSKRILRLPEVLERTGKSRSTLYAEMKNESFPKSLPIGKRAVGWLESDIDAWINSKINTLADYNNG